MAVQAPREMCVKRNVSKAGGQEMGDVPRFDFNEMPTPNAISANPSVEME